MKKIKIYIVDAFSKTPFRGNTCAVCIFPEWPPDELLQKIAAQNLLAETVYIVGRQKGNPELRWFTVSQEVDFCGYGTLSAGHVYLTHLNNKKNNVVFNTKNYGELSVEKKNDLYQMEVPVKKPLENIFNESVFRALGGKRPDTMVTSARGDLLIIYPTEADVRSISPDLKKLMSHEYYGYVLTSPGTLADYAYRYFSPRMTNTWEDPVNGASHSVLGPYWSQRLNKSHLHAQAVSQRGGDVYCEYEGGSTVRIGGHISPYSEGEILLSI